MRGRCAIFANGATIAISAFYALVFVPLLPVALLALVIVIGILPLAPLTAFVSALRLRQAMTTAGSREPRYFWGGLLTGTLVLIALDVPAAATRLGVQWAASTVPAERERGLSLLRTLGDDDLLLRLCYDAVGRPAGVLSGMVMFGGSNILDDRPTRIVPQSQAKIREVYYRVHGVPFNTKPPPFSGGKWARFADFQVDTDHGGTDVGGRVKGLDIVASRIDGSISGDDAVAYLEWTVEFRNSALVDREARLEFALPPGAVVSRATLWINGEEREAAYGSRAQVRAAYQKVAVVQRQDPLLVTTKGGDRVLAQAFPVGRNGGTIKFKIGITAPLELLTADAAQFILPAIVNRNFSFPQGLTHNVWLESKRPLSLTAPGLTASPASDSAPARITGNITDADLGRLRRIVTVQRDAMANRRFVRHADGETVVQSVDLAPSQKSPAVMLVVDGSRRLRATIPDLIKAIDAVPPTQPLGLILATEPVRVVPLAPASAAHKKTIAATLTAASFVGGQDNAPAIAAALRALESVPDATLLWVHGAQPVSLNSESTLEQTVARLKRLPRLTSYSIEPGPNAILPDMSWTWATRTLPKTAATSADLSAFLLNVSTDTSRLTIQRTLRSLSHGASTDDTPKGSDHIARLWAHEQVGAMMRQDPATNRAAATALAVKYRLITPVSGAVVLETQQQYDENRLTPVSQATVPTVPEPHEWALLLITCLAFGALAYRQRQHRAGLA
jgi:hypothetical protein